MAEQNVIEVPQELPNMVCSNLQKLSGNKDDLTFYP